MARHRSVLRAVCPLWFAVLLLACQAPPPGPELGSSASALSWGVASRIDPAAGREQLGDAMAASGDLLAVSSRIVGSREGVVSLYERVSGRFVLRQELRASEQGFPEMDAQFGYALALSGDTLAISVPRANALPGDRTRAGAVVVFVRSEVDGSFGPSGGPLRPPPVDADDTTYENRLVNFGSSLSLSGNVLAVGASGYRSRSGRAYVFERPSADAPFAQLADIPAPLPDYWDPAWGAKPTYANDTRFGTVVSLLGDRLLVGQGETSGNSQPGRVHTYARSGGVFVHRSELLAPAHPMLRETDFFGSGFAQHGDTLVVCSGAIDSKQLFAYAFDGATGSWTGPSYSDTLPLFKSCQPALSATRLVVGQARYPHGVDEVRVYPRVGSSGFGPAELATPGPTTGTVGFGAQVYADDSRVIASAPDFDSVGAVFDLGPRFDIHIPVFLPIWRWKWDDGCSSCPPDPSVRFVWPEHDTLLVQGGDPKALNASKLASAALHAANVQWLAVDALTERAKRLPDFVGLASDGTRLMGALGFADGQLRTEQEVDFKLRSDDGKLRPGARSEFAALYVAESAAPSVFMLGGKDEQGAVQRDLWRFDLKRGEWSSVASDLPESLAHPIALTYDVGRRTLYVAARGEQGNGG
jgi:hypothetical protein